MIVYLYDFNGLFVDKYECELDPLESKIQQKEIYLIPANCTETPPPQAQEGETVRFVDGQWTTEKAPEPTLEQLKQGKITALSATCEQTIYNGLELELSAGAERFEYKNQDQTNIKAMFDAVVLGAEKYPYQSEDGNCRVYTAQDIITLYTSLEGLRTAQLTYYHQLKALVNTLESSEEINAITYGQELEGEYLQHYNEMMAVAQEQMQLVLSKVVQNAV